jgi:hypothetical protein
VLERKPQKAAEGTGWNSKILPIRLASRPANVCIDSDASSTAVRRLWLRCAVDLDDVAVGIKREELGDHRAARCS